MTPEKKETATKNLTLRLTPEMYNRIQERAAGEGKNLSAWVKGALFCALENDTTEPVSIARHELVDMLLYDYGIRDIICECVAEKFCLNDIKHEIAEFAAYYKGETTSGLIDFLRIFSARMFYLLPETFHEEEVIDISEKARVRLVWEGEWNLNDFYALSSEEVKKYDVYFMECFDPNAPLRSEGIYFWGASENAEDIYPANFFSPDEHVRVHGAHIECNLSRQAIPDMVMRVVKMVRYVSRDGSLGGTGSLFDGALRSYFVRNIGYYPRGVPYEFTFGWVSDELNSGMVTFDEFREKIKRDEDKTLRPVVQCFWHYTRSEKRHLKLGSDIVVPFDEAAKPKHIGFFGDYYDADDSRRKGRIIKPVWVEEDDPERADYEEHKEVVRRINNEEE